MDAFLKRVTREAATFTIFAITLAGCGGHSSGGHRRQHRGSP